MPKKIRGIDSTTHNDERINNPVAGLAESDPNPDPLTHYRIDPNDSPSLYWAGKPESESFNVPATPIHKNETIYPHRLISPALNEARQGFLFPELSPGEILFEQARAIQSYNHKDSWKNRMIAGDSLIIMNSLLRKENMAGQVQMIYIDPPYGIKYGSNFQPFVGKRDVKDRSDDDLTAEPEMIRAFRDTWELGIHSYLTYLRSRLYLARELLSESGSVFVQISDENVHHVREICDEIFGPENFVVMIIFRKKGMPLGANLLERMHDFIVWYAKDKTQVKYHKLFTNKPTGEGTMYTWLELENGKRRPMTAEERKSPKNYPEGARPFRLAALVSAGYTATCMYDFELDGVIYKCGKRSWKTNKEGMKKIIEAGRVMVTDEQPNYVLFHDDYPVQTLTSLWDNTGAATDMRYVVQTSDKVISRCILMTTDPGDLVLDITCGSGTTAYCAEKFGRRWITCDTSRVAIAIARQRLMTATYDSYKLNDPAKGIASGFKYKTVPHVTLKSIANNEPPAQEILYDQPEIDSGKVRVSGPFTVESLPAPSVISLEEAAALDPDEQVRQDGFMSQLMATGIRCRGGERIRFSRHEAMRGARWIHSEAWTDEETPRRALVCFADSNTLMDEKRMSFALKEAVKQVPYPAMMIFCAFQFSPEAQTMINTLNWQGVQLMQVDMNDDLMTEDLKKRINTDESFWLVGQPDVELRKNADGKFVVRVLGYDYFSVSKDELISGNADKIAMWGIDPNYDGMTFTPSQIFFPMEGKSGGWSRLKNTLKAEIDSGVMDKYSGIESLPFKADDGNQIAVKIIDDRGIESMRLLTAGDAE